MFGIGKSANFLATLAVTLFTSELFPTPVRGTALFYTSIIDMVGILTVPFIIQEVGSEFHTTVKYRPEIACLNFSQNKGKGEREEE